MLLSKKAKNYDSEFCGSIPVNFINSIQAHGVLLVLEKNDLKIIQTSENIASILEVDVQEILKKPLSSFIGEEKNALFLSKIKHWPSKERIPYQFDFIGNSNISFHAIVHILEKYIIIELEEKAQNTETVTFLDLYSKIKYIMLSLKDVENLTTVAEISVNELKKMSEFDKVLFYQFDQNWNGTVLAEAKEEDMDSYMDLRFPASDIPQKARSLYLSNPYRLIPDVDFIPARLTPVMNPLTFSFTDLSTCNLRAVPKVHLEFLSNMGVKSSMSIPIIIHNQLWGLISFHHKETKHLGFEMLSAFELISNSISVQVAAIEREAKLKYKSGINNLEIRILEELYSSQDIYKSFENHNDKFLELFGVEGITMVDKNRNISKGNTPSEDQIKELTNWLSKYHHREKVFATTSLQDEYESALEFKTIATGLLAIKLTKNSDHYLLAFRPEVVETVKWGGNPNDAINFEADGKTYHPRNSFNIWKETVENTSDSWHQEELDVAEKIRIVMSEIVLGL